MRPSVRISFAGAAALIFLFTSLLSYYREVWRPASSANGLQTSRQYDASEPQEQPSSITSSSLGPEDALTRPTPVVIDTTSTPEQTKGVNLSTDHGTKTIVMAQLSTENTSWVHAELPDWSHYIYTVNDTNAPLHTSKNKGRESLAYLTYIVENYDRLNDTIAFIHSHKDGYPEAWHTDNEHYSNVESLSRLQIPYVQKVGYVNLRCNKEVGCSPLELQLKRNPKDESRTAENAMPVAWRSLMGEDEPVPDTIAVACCAQFAISKQQVLKRPLSDYKRYQRWILETELPDDTSGRIMEYFWHVMFGREAVFCPDVSACYCDVYGRCPG